MSLHGKACGPVLRANYSATPFTTAWVPSRQQPCTTSTRSTLHKPSKLFDASRVAAQRATLVKSTTDIHGSGAAQHEGSQETVFYEGSGSNTELAISLALGATLLYLPLTLASIGRRLWIQYKFTDKRVIVKNTSPLFAREVQVPYSKIKEIRTAPRAFGAWGDMVIFLKDGSRLELIGLERFKDIQLYIEGLLS